MKVKGLAWVFRSLARSPAKDGANLPAGLDTATLRFDVVLQHRSPNGLGSLYMVFGSVAAVINDGLVRVAVEDGLEVYQALFLRGCGMIAILILARRLRCERFDRRCLTRPLGVRVAAEVVVAAAFFAAIVHVEFANAHTILLAAPLVVTLVAARLGEQVAVRQYVLVTIGFTGVIAIMRPTPGGFSPWALLLLLAVVALVVREFATKRIEAETPPLTIAFLTAVALTAMTGMLSIVTGWGVLTARGAVTLTLACGFLVAAYVAAIEAVRTGDLAASAPFRYATVPGAVLVGLAFFGERPDVITAIGCALMVLAGVAGEVRPGRPPGWPSRTGLLRVVPGRGLPR